MRVLLFGQSLPYSMRVLQKLAGRVTIAGIVEAVAAARPAASPLVALAKGALDRPDLRVQARALAVPHLFFTRGQVPGLLAFLRETGAEAGCIASFPCLLSSEIIGALPRGILNLHPSLLPAYRGAMPVLWQFYRQETMGGVTVHFIDPGEDTGDIVAQEPVPILLDQSGAAYMDACANRGGDLLARALEELAAGSLQRRPQRDLPCPFRARSLKRGEVLLDFRSLPIGQTFRALQGGYNILEQLLPPPAGLLRHCDLAPSRWDRTPPGIAPGQYGWALASPFLAHAEGRIFLRARPSRRRLLNAIA